MRWRKRVSIFSIEPLGEWAAQSAGRYGEPPISARERDSPRSNLKQIYDYQTGDDAENLGAHQGSPQYKPRWAAFSCTPPTPRLPVDPLPKSALRFAIESVP